MKITAILGISVVLGFIIVLLRDKCREYALAVAILGGALLLFGTVKGIIPIIDEVKGFLPLDDVNTVPVMKALGIGYITAESSDILKTVGEDGLSRWVNLYGKVAVMAVSLPVIGNLFEAVRKLL